MYLDIFIGVIVLYALVRGCLNGFIKEIASAVGFMLGLLVAITCYEQFGQYLKVDGSEVNMFTSIIAFLLLWIIVPIVFGFIANLLTKAIEQSSLSFMNRLLGGLVSVAKFVVLLSCVLNVMAHLGILNKERTKGSLLSEKVMWITASAVDQVADAAVDIKDKTVEFIPNIVD